MTEAERKIETLLGRMVLLARQGRARCLAGLDASDLRREMARIRFRIGREEAKRKRVAE